MISDVNLEVHFRYLLIRGFTLSVTFHKLHGFYKKNTMIWSKTNICSVARSTGGEIVNVKVNKAVSGILSLI